MEEAHVDELLRRRGSATHPKGASVANRVTAGQWFGPCLAQEVSADKVEAELQDCVSTTSVSVPKQHPKKTVEQDQRLSLPQHKRVDFGTQP